MSLRKNAASNLLLKLTNIFFPLVTFSFVTRKLSTEKIGSIFFIDAIAQYLLIFASCGIPIYGIREIAKLKRQENLQYKTAVELFSLQLIISIILCLIFLASSFFVEKISGERYLVIFACLQILSTSFLMEWYFQGLEQYSYISIRSIAVKLVATAVIFAVIRTPSDYIFYYATSSVALFINATINFFRFSKINKKHALQRLAIKKHLPYLMPFLMMSVSVSIYTVLDSVILGCLTNNKAVALYNVGLRIAKLYGGLLLSISFVSMTKMTIYNKENNIDKAKALMRHNLNFVVLTATPFALLCILLPKEILAIVAGNNYEGAIITLRIVSFLPFIIAVSNIFGTQYLVPSGKEKNILHATIGGFAISLTLNFLFIPFLAHNGAAIACLFTELGVMFLIIRKFDKIKSLFERRLIQISIATSLITIFVWSFAKQTTSGANLIFLTASIYSITFIVIHFFVLRSKFIDYLIPAKN